MIRFLRKVIVDVVKRRLRRKNSRAAIHPRVLAKAVHVFKVELADTLRGALFISLGVVSASIGLKSFLLPSHFIDGGVTGISLLVQQLTGISLSLLLVVINLPFLILGSRTIGRQLAIRSVIAIVLLSVAVVSIPYPVVTHDKLLIAVFGGFFLGMGIGLAMRGGAVIDGTEVLAVYLSKKLGLSIGDIILIFNILIFSVSAYILSLETALYAILTYLSAAKTVDFVIDGIEEYIGVTIISHLSEEIRLTITEKLGRGCTIYAGKRGFGKRGDQLRSTDIIFTVITRLELAKLKSEVDKIDSEAFIVMSTLKDTKGGMVKKRPLAH
jgi:uncharacterized membrane-anchored protein YitT (DUF2179 family)